MKFKETLRIDKNFLIDEEGETFCYKKAEEYDLLPAKNIQSCIVMADVDSISEDYFYIEEVPDIGKVHFVKDLSNFSKAILSGNNVLTISFLDKNGKIRLYEKKYESKDRTPYNIMSRINKLIDHNQK